MKTIIAIIVVLLAAWGIYALVSKGADTASQNTQQSTNSSQDENNTAGAVDENSSNSAATINTTSDATLGTILTSSSGMTLYKFTKDTPGVSNCSGDCAVKWPPYTVTSAADLTAISGVSGKLGTVTRADGMLQVSYNDMPLYFWYQDTKPGDTNGQNVGGVWFVVNP